MQEKDERMLATARRVVEREAEAMGTMEKELGAVFLAICREVDSCRGRIVVTGMGKSGHVARKIAATMASLGVCSFFLHPAEAMHGDLGMIREEDVVIAISYSGESEEIVKIIPNIKTIGARLIGITSNAESTLARKSDIVQCFPNMAEACHLGLAPTTSTTVVMAYGDALAVAVSEARGFAKNNFAVFHPAGSLGKKLTIRVTDLMDKIECSQCVEKGKMLVDAIKAFGRQEMGIIPVNLPDGRLCGIITNGALERLLEEEADIYHTGLERIINELPVYVEAETMAIEALRIMMDHGIKSMPVVLEERVIGVISVNAILGRGIYL
ncbi:MAG: KpsF/GutQ family sugar-phosphate isomerase [Lachnospiraceae bacterium]|nr:KpsF/GutQ family sugar-phosphate isomerase [Lachnospiraceae bacterium]